MPVKSVVLLSGGLDSSVNLYEAHEKTDLVMALTFDYGQSSVQKEIEASQKLCLALSVPHKILDLKWLGGLGTSALTDQSRILPTGVDVQIDDLERSKHTAQAVWVPNRNGLFVNVAACFAEALGADQIVPGFNLEEAMSFPDNSAEFVQVSTQALQLSTANAVRVHCYTIQMNKTQMVERAIELGVPLAELWPCYKNEEKWCGQCESCQRFKRAGGFEAATQSARSED